MDNAMRGYDELHTAVTLFPGDVRLLLTAWFLKLKSLRLNGESVAQDYVRELSSVLPGGSLPSRFARAFASIERDASFERQQAEEVYKSLFEAIPKRWLNRLGAGIEQPYRTLEEAERAGAELGLTPRESPTEAATPTPPPASNS
jgi:hypothetical protein